MKELNGELGGNEVCPLVYCTGFIEVEQGEVWVCVLQLSCRLSQSQIFLSFGQTFLSQENSSRHGTLPRSWGHTRWVG